MGWFSKSFGKIGGAILGVVLAPATAGASVAWALGGAAAGHVFIDQPKVAESAQEKQIAAQKEMQAQQFKKQAELAGQQFTLTEKQMELQMGQRQIELLANLFDRQDRTEPEIYYLPAAEPTSPVTRINLAIDEFFR